MSASTTLACGLVTAFLVPALAAQSSQTTLFTGGNSLNAPGSNMMDLTVTNPGGIVVTSLDVNCENTRNGPLGTPFELRVYLTARGGTYVGNHANSALWYQVALGNGISAATGTPTPVDISDFFLPAGQYGMAIYYHGVTTTPTIGTAFAYTNGNGTNQSYTNADFSLSLGIADSGLFSATTYSPRVWNGTIHYEAGTNAAYGVYGAGCAAGSPSGVPQLLPNAAYPVPRLGNLFQLDVNNLGTVADLGILVFGFSTVQWGSFPLPLDLGMFGMPGCQALVSVDSTAVFPHTGSGSANYLMGIPNLPGLAGRAIGTQVLMLDPQATNPTAVTVSNLAAGRIGN